MISVSQLAAHAGSFSISGITFEVPTGQYAAVMGRTGVGKTTLLECICGLRRVSAGRIELDGRDVTHAHPADRNIGFVPQDGALFETMSVFENLAFSLDVRRWPREAIRRRVAELADFLKITHLLSRRPPGLSGGEKQRVALGRALAFRPQVLCLDEPLSALDEATRAEMYALLADVRQETGVTTLHITHNAAECEALADIVLHVADGCVTTASTRGENSD